ncbi:MAG: hypothetical protein LBH36_00785 [Candidatus Nomurabacteria bacterium]|nr:hypothetical protein [Candidatus Nomurabacteria bacterium]
MYEPKFNKGYGGKLFTVRPWQCNMRPMCDSITLEHNAAAVLFHPSDSPIITVVAVGMSRKTAVASFHFGYRPICEGVGDVMNRWLHKKARDGFALYAYISGGGAKSIELSGDHAKLLRARCSADAVLKAHSTVTESGVILRLCDYAKAACAEYVPSCNIDQGTAEEAANCKAYILVRAPR